MSWTKVNDATTPSKLEIYTITLTADGSGVFTVPDLPDMKVAYFIGCDAAPGGTAPDSSIDITFLTDLSIDLLNGSGAAVDISSAGKRFEPADANGNAKMAPFTGVVTPAIANNGTASAIVTLTAYFAIPLRYA